MTEQFTDSYSATFDTNVLGTLLSMRHDLRAGCVLKPRRDGDGERWRDDGDRRGSRPSSYCQLFGGVERVVRLSPTIDEYGADCNTKRKPSGHRRSSAYPSTMIETFTTNLADESLHLALLSRRPSRNWMNVQTALKSAPAVAERGSPLAVSPESADGIRRRAGAW